MDPDCVFCKIIKGDLPSYRVYQDTDFFGFLDIHPLNPGNVLLVPKVHYRWVTDVPNFGRYFDIAKNIGLAAQKVVSSDYTSFLTLGMEVHHAHIRIIPRFYNDAQTKGIDTTLFQNIAPEEMQRLASEIFTRLT